jgi:choline dehydrogenase-like flavoprotein
VAVAAPARTVAALCETLVPPHASLGRSGADVADGLAADAAVLAALGEDFAVQPLSERTRRFREAARGDAQQPLRELKAAVMALVYAAPDEHGRNPTWPALGYPGPISQPPSPEQAPKTIPVERVSGGRATLQADVCVVGSGAGGSVVAAELQRAGRSVVVLERGGYRNEADFRQLEWDAARTLYLGAGLVWSESGSIGLLAGSTLGGGTVVNSLVCLRPPAQIRDEWARLGLDGLDGDEFDRHLDAVSARLGVNTEATQPNRTNQLLAQALELCGRSWELIPRNASPDDDPRFCGYCNAGCQQGCKQSTLKTYLQDAADAGARFIVDCDVRRILVTGRRAVGVEARVGATELVVEAPTVVVAAGGIGSPVLLLRSGLGGPAAGKFLRLHPTYFVSGVYDEDVHAWSGQFQSIVSWDWDGFLVESVGLSPSFWAANIAWRDGAAHRDELLKLRRVASWHALAHDHGAGEVVLDARGEPVVRWELSDAADKQLAAQAHAELARLHAARGAAEIFTFHWDDLRWRRGDDLDAYAAALEGADHGRVAFSAHQMGSCRLGSDPEASVADPRGQLHDVRGVWIADASGLPTAPGVNPMITIMALARRTATRMLAA